MYFSNYRLCLVSIHETFANKFQIFAYYIASVVKSILYMTAVIVHSTTHVLCNFLNVIKQKPNEWKSVRIDIFLKTVHYWQLTVVIVKQFFILCIWPSPIQNRPSISIKSYTTNNTVHCMQLLSFQQMLQRHLTPLNVTIIKAKMAGLRRQSRRRSAAPPAQHCIPLGIT